MASTPYDLIVSLGANCQPAHHIRRVTGTKTAQIFDWCVTPDRALCHAIRNGFDNWFDPECLVPHGDGGYLHKETKVFFLHEFAQHPDFETGYSANAERIERRILRWHSLAGSGKRVLFIRQHVSETSARKAAAALVAALVASTNLSFDLLYLVKPAMRLPFWKMRGVTFRHNRPKGPDEDWRGYDSDWDAHFASMGVAKLDDLGLGNADKSY